MEMIIILGYFGYFGDILKLASDLSSGSVIDYIAGACHMHNHELELHFLDSIKLSI